MGKSKRIIGCSLLLIFLIAGCNTLSPTSTPPDLSVTPIPPVSTVTTPLESISPTPISSPTPLPSPTQEIEPSPTGEPTVEQPAPSPTVAEPPDASGDNSNTCENKAAFFDDITIPDKTSMQQGQSFEKIWRIRNEGTCTWGSDYSLAFSGGDPLNGPLNSPLPLTGPGEIVDISLNLSAPKQGGLFTGYYVFQDPQGKRFGVNSGGIDTIWVQISVSWYAPGEVAGEAAVQTQEPPPTTAASTATSVPAGCAAEQDATIITTLLSLINQARTNQGLATLSIDDRLNNAAQSHSLDMGCKDFIDHIGSNGSRWNDRIAAQGYNFAHTSENIYVGNPAFGGSPQGAFEWWMNSPVHRANILNPKVTQIGIGYVFVAQSSYGGYYTLNFARPK
jgi:uncharacterized protein YkwD